MALAGARDIVILLVFLMFVLPLLFKVFHYAVTSTTNPSPEKFQEGVELMVDASTPWWLGIFERLADMPGIIGAILVILFAFFLRWIGEIR
jgi:hypothetical protein